MATALARTGTELPRGRRLLVLAICCMSLLIVGLDVTVVNVALPAIHRSLHASLSGLQWVVDAYSLVLASLLMISGSTGDRIGRRRTFQTGLLLFVAGSALCAAAPTLSVLIAARALQAIGGSMLNPVAMSIIRNVFNDPKERAQAIGMWGAVSGLSLGLGPVLGGALVDSVGWRFVFLINLPIGLTAIILTALYVPESRAEHARRIDPVGQLLVICGLASLTYAIIEGPGHGWRATEIIALFALAAACFTVLVPYELRRREPLINVRFFRSAPFAGAIALAVFTYASYGGFLFLNTIYLQEVRGLSALDAGLYTLPVAVMIMVFAPVSGRLVARRGTRWPLLLSALSMIVSPLLLLGLQIHTSLALLFGSYALFGAGNGLINTPITNTAVSEIPASQAGVAAAVISASRWVGTTVGIAVLGALTGAGAAGSFGAAFARATHPVWWLLVALGVIMLGIGVVSSSAWARASASATARQLAQTGGS